MKRTISVACAVVASLMAAGCMTPPPGMRHAPPEGIKRGLHGEGMDLSKAGYRRCKNAGVACRVDVEIKTSTGGACFARVVDDAIVVIYHPNQLIQWQLDSGPSGLYDFAQDGIVVEGDDPNDAEFVPETGSTPGMYRMRSRNREAKAFKYTIHTVKRAGGACEPLDPIMINRGN